MKNNFEEKLVLITGGSSGIGFALAEVLVKMGSNVFIVARHIDDLKRVASELNTKKVCEKQKIGYFRADVADDENITSAIKEFINAEGVPDYLINSAGVSRPGLFEELENDVFLQMILINYLGTVYTTKAVIKGMIKRGSGHIVNISSIAGFLGVYGYTAYGSSKFAIRGLSEALRYEMRLHGVKVSVVYPPDTQTPQLAGDTPYIPFITKELAGNRPLTAQYVAHSILKGIARGAYIITPGFDSSLYYLLDNILGNLEYPIMDFLIWLANNKLKKNLINNNRISIGEFTQDPNNLNS